MFDYKDLNLKIGLEIHQQLSDKKLFCDCSTKFQEKELDLEFSRKLRAVAGEQGLKDIAAEFEQSRNREFIYHGYNGEYCLVECDDDPPHEINKDALITALSLAKLFKLNIPDELITMRKIITDGSACSSFQRTILIGLESKNSFIETSLGKVKITSLCLEEDACKIEKREENKVYYSLSRQGIPLIEIRTDPDIKTPEHAKETAEKIGMILRSFSNVLRGIGTIRQDVNLSINNGARVEIKGFQELRIMPKIIDFEIQRQVNIIKQGKKVEKEVRNANENGTTNFLRPLPGSARMYPDTDLGIFKVNEKILNEIKIPELISDKINDLQKKYNLSEELSSELIKQNIDFGFYTRKYDKISLGLLASLLINYYKENNLELALNLLNSEKITKEIFDDVIKKGEISPIEEINLNEVKKEIKEIINEKPDLSANAIMGILMNKYRGKIQGSKLIELIKKFSTK
jgi:Glu-tRNA(Gln) amidotransferase subunit E-like FAD-binding protein